MKRTTTLFYSFLIVARALSQEIPSPGSFLGYPLGSRFTPHFRIVEYFDKLAGALPSMVRVERYGQTYEGRPLLLAFIASPENLRRLESIRMNNLRLAGVAGDQTAPDENSPAIVWLSYNVHGNEPSSSEAAMKTAYELVNPANTAAKEWLRHVVVIIDPCINPDGRDRYVNWYVMTSGRQANPDPQSREHHEPWPGGRTNHYNFDLNRDWAWQTQVETRQRMKQYNAWLPQVHVDFHEQGYNDPYYFAPAAEPYHDVITPWQREFQTLIGRNNARYFDKEGWLFFTKEKFDLFYPSYGDTYPMYNGAIGMTFEQGGHSAGGLSVITAGEDTLSLADRLEHHFTTGISTIEVSSQQSGRLVREFRKYFAEARSHPGAGFSAWIIKSGGGGDAIEELKLTLERNGITWMPVTPGNYSGLDYQTGRITPFHAGDGDLLIDAAQPRSNLLRVLFERVSRISDSVTYDITAWSLPFVYGLQTYGLSAAAGQTAAGKGAAKAAATDPAGPSGYDTANLSGSYGLVVRWTGLHSAKFLAALLEKGVKVRYADQPFESSGRRFERGSLIIAPTGNGSFGKGLGNLVRDEAQKAGVTPFTVSSGFVDKGADFGSGHVHLIHKPRVALLTGAGVHAQNAGEIWYFFEQELDYPVTLIEAADAPGMDWRNYDVVILPAGNYKYLNDKSVSDGLRKWVRDGGRLIALENAVAQMAAGDWGILKRHPPDEDKKEEGRKDEDYAALKKYEDRERNEVAGSVPGSIYRVELDNSHPLAFGYTDRYYTLKQDDNVYEFLKEGGWNVGVIRKDNYISGFTGARAKEKLKDGLVFGVQDMGKGEIVYMADDPLFRSFWENGKLLFCNAVFFVGQ
ncbi:MAG: M14 family metallopeptidase [Bacteroidota bacterium]|nr:M14 family metallopeptidase [Bacteroidota bacterium]MDP4257509.1 M14 family metallopeptidase [Bacteroidota bacterium]